MNFETQNMDEDDMGKNRVLFTPEPTPPASVPPLEQSDDSALNNGSDIKVPSGTIISIAETLEMKAPEEPERGREE